MRLEHFDLNLLVVLDALLQERNVTRASERVHIGQSAASAALARLRSYFDDELLVPVGRQLMLTPLARTLIEPVRESILSVRSTLSRRPDFDPMTARREFTLWGSDYVTAVLFPALVRRLATQSPGMVLHLHSSATQLFDRFQRGEIDLLVIPDRYAIGLGAKPTALFDDEHVGMLCADHPEVGDALSYEQYLALGQVTVRVDLPGGEAFEEWLFSAHRKLRRVEMSVDSFSTLLHVLAGTRRMTVTYRRLAEHYAKLLPLRVLELPFKTPPLVETMSWPPYLEEDPAHRWLREVLVDCARGLGVGA